MVSSVSSGKSGIMIPDSEFSYWLCIGTMWLLKKKSLKDNVWTLSDSIIVFNCDMHTFFFPGLNPDLATLVATTGHFWFSKNKDFLSLPYSKNIFLITSTRLLRHWNWINMKNIIDFLISEIKMMKIFDWVQFK